MLIEAYADGSATIASKPGGYGWCLVVDGVKHSEGNGHMLKATNNDAELQGAIQVMAQAVRFLMTMPGHTAEVHLRCDSQIVLNWANGTSQFKQKAKEEQYQQLRSLFIRLKAQTKWVRGHSGHEHNERCDELATLGRLKLTPQDEIPSKKSRKINKIGKRTENTICVIFRNVLKIIDIENNLIENYNPTIHGERKPTMASVPLNMGDDIK